MKRNIDVVIGGHTWSIRRLKDKDMTGTVGKTWSFHFAIDLNEELTEKELPLVIRHEVCHALLDTQGRAFQTKFGVEELCEFVAWNHEQIGVITQEIMERLLSK